jgi:hypothetical protein
MFGYMQGRRATGWFGRLALVGAVFGGLWAAALTIGAGAGSAADSTTITRTCTGQTTGATADVIACTTNVRCPSNSAGCGVYAVVTVESTAEPQSTYTCSVTLRTYDPHASASGADTGGPGDRRCEARAPTVGTLPMRPGSGAEAICSSSGSDARRMTCKIVATTLTS